MAFTHYKSVTIAHGQVGANDLTDFPVSIWITDNDFRTVALGGKVQNVFGFDIRPYPNTVPSSALTFEFVADTYNATTGTFEMHVKLPTVSHTSDTVFYLFVGDAALNTDGSSTATWNSHFKAVWHFPNSASLTLADSTSNAHNAAASGAGAAPTAVAGVVDGAANSSSDWLIDSSSIGILAGNAAWSITAWCSTTISGGGGGGAVYAEYNGGNDFLKLCIDDGVYPGKAQIIYRDDAGTLDRAPGTTIVNTGVFFHLSGQLSGGNFHLYANGAPDGTTARTATNTFTESLKSATFAHPDGAGFLAAKLDELRLSDVARGDDWTLAEYNNQVTGSTFLTWGTLTPVTTGNTFFLIPN